VTEVGAGGELVNFGERDVCDMVAKTDYIAAAASRDRVWDADQAKVLELALDAADTMKAQDSLEKMLTQQTPEPGNADGVSGRARRQNEAAEDV